MNQQIDVNELVQNLPIVNPNRQYWLFRTDSGDYYEEFRDSEYIAIGWNEIPLANLAEINLDPTNEALYQRIRDKVSVHDDFTSERSRRASQSKAISQLLKFAYEIKRGDVVVIPSQNSDFLSFGEILDTPAYVDASGNCPFTKRKRVMWIKKDVRRLSLDSNLYRFIFAHQTINNVTDYAGYINNTLFDFYTINGQASLVLRVRKNEAYDSFRVGDFYNDLLFFLKELSEENGEKIKQGDINVKFDIQSPGIIVFFGIMVFAFVCLGVMTILAGGEGGYDVDQATHKIKFNFKSNSLLDKLSDFLDRKQERKIKFMRLMGELRHFEVDKNNNLGELMEPTGEEPNDNPGDDIQN